MEYTITIHGKGGHGSRPDKSCNPLDCFAAVYGALQIIGCAITDVDGGNANNIIPEKLTFVCRCENEAALKQLLEHTCAAYNCTAEIA